MAWHIFGDSSANCKRITKNNSHLTWIRNWFIQNAFTKTFSSWQPRHLVRTKRRFRCWIRPRHRLSDIAFRIPIYVHMRREEKPARCHWMVYCTYNMLNMFRALLSTSSGARDYMCVITAYGVRCLRCWLLEVRCRTAGYAFGMRDVTRATSLIPNA